MLLVLNYIWIHISVETCGITFDRDDNYTRIMYNIWIEKQDIGE